MARVTVVAVLAVAVVALAQCAAGQAFLNVWPPAQSLQCTGSDVRKLSQHFTISSSQAQLNSVAARYKSVISNIVDTNNAWAPENSKNALTGIVLNLSQSQGASGNTDSDLASDSTEAYTVSTNNNDLVVHTPSLAGAVYALETIAQILAQSKGAIPCSQLQVTDAPALAHRGIVLDVASRYFDLATIHDLIDSMAMLKFNALGLHFSDFGAFRAATDYNDLTDDLNGMYPGHVLKHLTTYAADRGITLSPHLELPTHASGFAPLDDVFFCTPTEPTVANSVLNNDDSTSSVLQQVMANVAERFDSPLTFVGGAGIGETHGNCSAADVQKIFMSAFNTAHVAQKQVAVWEEAVQYLDNSPKDTIAYAVPTTDLTDLTIPTVVSGDRSQNALLPSLPFA